jgi:hypothetical protein
VTVRQFVHFIEVAERRNGTRVHVPKGSFQARASEGRYAGNEHVLMWDGGADCAPVYRRAQYGHLGPPIAEGTAAIYAWEEAAGLDLTDEIGLDLLLWDDRPSDDRPPEP